MINTPLVAPRPVATIIEIGVARPSAHGQAIISTETALTTAYAKRGSLPHIHQTKNDIMLIPITAGTKYPDTTSASFCIGARERCASETISMICESSVSAPIFWVLISRLPLALIVAPITLSPANFFTAIGSPVTIDSSTLLSPSMTTPSTGTFSPGRTRKTSPT